MFDVEILKNDYGVSYGSVTLKSLQNDNIPELDLLVREAIQNSSDAALTEDGDFYTVNFQSGTFAPKRFNSLLDGIEEVLNYRYPELKADFLEIRDTKTSGLTGCIHKEEVKKDDHGNFFKLIFDTGKRQKNPNAGGNWGFGKSVYYRVGIGIVIFYSRIKNENYDFENRLIITLVEDEEQTDSVLNSVESRSVGKAWWGIREGEDLLPIRDDEIIKSVLDIFGIKPFKENQTGTSIVIPYIKTGELLDGIIPVEAEIREDVREHFVNIWASSVSSYLRLAIQKWYAPKIHNRELKKFCDNKWLRVSINNEDIRKEEMLPFFRLVQDMYTAALAKSYGYAYKSTEFDNISVLPVKINKYFEDGQTSGYVAISEISMTELNNMENVLSPYDYIGKFEYDGELKEPVVMFARNPGMVIDYAVTGDWVKNVSPPENPEKFLFAFYVPTTEKIIKKNLGVPGYEEMKFGEYLRNCEASDHMEWNDPVKMQIVQRVQKACINAINKFINDEKINSITNSDATASKLANRLGKNLLPIIGYGKKKTSGGTGGGGGTGTKTTNITFDITSQTICGNEVDLDFTLKMMHGKKDATISVFIASEEGWIDANSWREDIGTEFPISIINCYIDNMKTVNLPNVIEVKQNYDEKNVVERDEIMVSLISENNNKGITRIQITSNVVNPEISGKIRIRTYDKKYQYKFDIE